MPLIVSLCQNPPFLALIDLWVGRIKGQIAQPSRVTPRWAIMNLPQVYHCIHIDGTPG